MQLMILGICLVQVAVEGTLGVSVVFVEIIPPVEVWIKERDLLRQQMISLKAIPLILILLPTKWGIS